ncbi:hypothetical protein D9615_003376 [Tricholomella constricta]|uniref:USP domain-containing protein n=1 Tax=Tricholomella constricta TaxID=117010 RepID=A0A8H5HJM0_9AGAR|nr:hypothetical protein D9615_003376 [Tricholomella constricta]
MTPEEAQEEETVVMLTGMMGGDVGQEEARRVLRKHKGDVQKAADAMLEGDRGEEESSTWQNTTQSSQDAVYNDPSSSSNNALATQSSSSTVIDLTSDDNDFTRTWQLNQAQSEVKFGPTERAPDPSWQMVTTNAPIDTQHDDRSLKDAIQASLADFNSDDLEMFPVEDGVREGGRPIALRPESSPITYAALIMQALFHVPQVRESVAKLRFPSSDPDAPRESYESIDSTVFSLVELFTNLDLAQLSSMVDKEVLPCLGPTPWDGSTEALGELSSDFFKNIGSLIEAQLNAQKSEDEPEVRLFQFQHAQAESRGNSYKVLNNKATLQGSVVMVETGDTFAPNDLISRLSSNLSRYTGSVTAHDVIVEPMELVAFHLKLISSATSGPGKPSAEPFIYPKHFYLDRFLLENILIADKQRALEREMQVEIDELIKRKEFITHSDNRDTLKDLRASLHYYEHVAESNGNPDRQAAILRTSQKLRNIVDAIIAGVHGIIVEIDAKVEKLQADLAVVFDCPELQNHRYDLRAVFMHTGLPGRKQIYSYVQDNHGVWWKTIDYTVTEVSEETVLTDPTGLHLGAGPYLVIYSRHLSEEQMKAPVAWPKSLVDSVEDANQKFLSMLPPESAGKSNVPLAATASTSSMTSLSFPFSPAVFPGQEESQSMDVDAETHGVPM